MEGYFQHYVGHGSLSCAIDQLPICRPYEKHYNGQCELSSDFSGNENQTEADMLQETHIKSITYWEQGEKEKAFSMVCETYGKDQDNKSVLDSVISMGMELEQYESVEKSIREYLQCHPANLDALVSLAEVLILTGMTDQAKKELKKVLIFDPLNGKVNLLLDQIEEIKNSVKQLS
jgi:predicted Zn-dependent protease